MIIFRGWGLLGAAFPALTAFALGALPASMYGSKSAITNIVAALGALVGGALGFLCGRWLNVIRPRAKVAEWQEQRRAELRARVDAGQFQMAPGLQAPSSREEGYAQVEQLITNESPDVLRQLKNIHTLFFIPMQWFAIGVGVVIFFGALSTALR
ncbi:hypothetical protein [Arachnia propionica]|jgi:hypothetical protein|uniref:Uncharacterized protein n=1 Tax=Arachnia propionica TaxID=1750 RepID=A0A3S5ESV4_9ACTN|nr:hypothetical protein [Arachnia propionica]QUC13752.1 hypothetical protein J5A61_12990 [Arachnia propionica]VEH71316.1 Uncharacterised protein [Arachnia propionica]